MATMTIVTDNFITVLAESHDLVRGSLARDPTFTMQSLSTPGVDGRRYRKVHAQHTILVADVLESISGDHSNRETLYQQAVGRTGRLTVETRGQTHIWPRITVVGVTVMQRAGQVIGASVGDKSILARWVIDRQDAGRVI